MAFIRILIVEDTSTQAFILQHLLELEGYEVIIKKDGTQAIEFLK